LETFQYNGRNQLTEQTGLGTDINYWYSSTANDGRLAQKHNWVTGEEENYTYDSLGRLATAYTTGTQWGLSFVYDGFGNRLQQNVTKGTAPSTVQTVDTATNRLNGAGFGYDSNGNMTGWSTPSGSVTASYDIENRMTQIVTPSVTETYKYGPGNLRVKKSQGSSWVYTVYGQGGEALGTFTGCSVGGVSFLCEAKLRVYFGGRLVLNGWTGVRPDRLGSPDGTHGRVYPYGEVSGSVSVDQDETFTTYKRDVYTGLDYAQNRYYASSWGRFTTADPYQASAGPADPQSWNRYAYVVNDPVSLLDPTGRQAAAPTGQGCTVVWYSLWFDVTCNGSASTDIGGGGGGGGDTLVSNVYAFADPDPPNESAPEGSDPIWWDWRPQGGSESAGPGESGGGGGTITTQKEDWKEKMNCAADFGEKHSIVAGMRELTGAKLDNPFLGTAFGNDAASISDIVTGRNRIGAAISEVFSNPSSRNVFASAARGVGAIPIRGSATAELGVNSAGSYFVRTWNQPSVASSIVGRTAGGILNTFSKAKALYDVSVYGVGLIACP
ncbi:RHS repeat-associated core domain-containing protein, partial [Paludibaculum fermentans]|uniref:RHS repeat-associated core domain-containing protein n=1 Tax=Paludibaculum fermentans TaxID=1473598 RepID=UPI003EBD1526